MAQHSTPELDDQFPLHPQEIRSAALQAAARTLADTLPDSDAVLNMAAKFETYIEYGRPEAASPVEDPWVNPGLWVGSITITPEKIEAGREKLMAAIRSDFVCSNCGPYIPSMNQAHRCPEPTDLGKGLCDQCDNPYTGGSAGGGLPSEYWCDNHRPLEVGGPKYPADQSTPARPPTTLPAIDLVDELAAALARANEERDTTQYPKWRPDAEAALVVFRERIGAMPASSTYEDVYRALFGNIGATQ